jgi:C-terminal processing protease CtpA/Prc
MAGRIGSSSKLFDAAYAAKRPGEHVRFEIPEVAPREGARYRGVVDVLVNRHSYSNTVMVAAIVQDYGFGRVIGEETADLASTYGAMETFALPRTGIVVGYPKARILRPNGDARARGVIPDVAIETPVVPSREDVVLERALALPASKDVAAERR